MANSFVRYTGNNSTTAYSIPFSYRTTGDLTVTLAGSATTAFTLNAAGTTLTFNTAPALNVAIEIRRTTSQTTRLTDYASGSVLTENDLDTDSEQAFFMSQEAIDDADDVIKISNTDFQYDAGNKQIRNVANPTSNQDVATKHYLENTFLTTANKTALTTINANISNIIAVNNNSTNINSAVSNATNINTVATNIGSVNTVATDISKVIAVANDLAEAVSEVETVADDLNETTSEINTVGVNIANVNNVGNNIANVNTVAGNSANVTTVAGNNSNVSTVAGISSDVTAVAGISSDVQAVENIKANVTTVAGISSAVSNVSGIASAVSAVNSNSSNINAVNSNATNINTVAGNNSNISTVAGVSSDVTTVAGISSDVQAVENIASNVTTVAGMSTAINTVNSNATNVNAVGGAIANVNLVGGSIANVNTVAGIDGNVTTVAGISSDVTAVAGISTAVSNVNSNSTNINAVNSNSANINAVAGDATDIGAVATNIASVNTVAGISGNVTTVANDATDIGTVATNIANVNNVGGSITNVNNVGSNIAGVNAFAERYRVASSDPTSSLDAGDLAFNTSGNVLKYYDGSSWQGITAGGITDIVQDSTPQLGGNLDLNSNDITGTGNINITGNLTSTGIDDNATSTVLTITSGTDVQIGSTNSGVGGTIDLSIGNTSSSGGITLWSPTSASHSIGFGDGYTGTDRYRGYLEYLHSGDSMRFGTSATERMRLNSTGVGIGTSAPNSNLHVSSGGNTKVRFDGNANNNTSTFLISHVASGDVGLQFNSNQLNMFSYGDIAFYPSTSNISGSYPNNEVMRIRNNGKVGISTSDPKEKLDSRGSAVFSGDHATSTNAYGTAHGILLSSTSNLGKITAISNGSNDVKLELRGLDGGTANSNQLVLDGGTSNVGIGVTPSSTSASGATIKGLVIGGNNATGVYTGLQLLNRVENSTTSNGIAIDFDHKTSSSTTIPLARVIAKPSSSTSGDLQFYTSSSSSLSERMRLTDTGLGIGTSSPEGTLHIEAGSSGSSYSADGADKLILENNSSVVFDIRTPASDQGIIAFSDTTRAVGLIGYNHSENSLRFSTAGAERLRITSAGKVSIGNTNASSFGSLATDLVIGTTSGEHGLTIVTGTGNSARMQFSDNTSSPFVGAIEYAHSSNALMFYTSGSQKMKITSSGEVGIGNTVPGDFNSQAKNLVIGGGSGDTGMTIYSGSGSGDTGNIFFADGTSGSDQVRGGITYNHGDNSMNFRTNDGANRIYISSGGSVGIATSSPSEKLEVNGNVKATAFQGDGSALTGMSSGGMTLLSSTNLANITGATVYRIAVNLTGYNIMYISLGRIATNSTGVMPDFKLGFNNDSTGSNYMFYRKNADNAQNKGDLSHDSDQFFMNGSGFAGFTPDSAQAIFVYAPANTDRFKTMSFTSMGVQHGTSGGLKLFGGGQYRSNSAITECTFTSAQTLNHGVIDIYGIK